MNKYLLPEKMKALQARVRTDVQEFLANNRPEDSTLVLDSTGVTATRHYVLLNAIGRERLLRFKEIHVFSGGAFALFGFLGLTSNSARLTFPDLRAHHTEKAFRSYHHKGMMSVPSALLNLVRRKSVFSSNDPVYAMLDHIFRPEYAHQPYSEFPSNVVVHLGRKGSPPILRVSNGALCDEECKSLRGKRLIDVIVSAVTVPMVYGRSDGADHWFDPVYAGQYGKILRDTYSTGAPTLVSTPWKNGQKGNVRFANCFPSKRQKLDMLNDFARLVLNLPNHGWGHDIYAAFES
jgi:hypothetical protein